MDAAERANAEAVNLFVAGSSARGQAFGIAPS